MFSPEVSPILTRDFVIMKIDTDRYKEGQEILNRVRGSEGGGIPWFAFLEPDAKAPEAEMELGAQIVGTSDIMDGQNIGAPYSAKEIAAFEKLLQRVSRTLDEEALAILHKTLVAQGEKPKVAPVK